VRQIVANEYKWNPYLHTCNPNLQSHHWLHQPTAIAAATVTATIAVPAAATTTATARYYPLTWRLFPTAIAAAAADFDALYLLLSAPAVALPPPPPIIASAAAVFAALC
jgi:hypothetical protein